MSFWSGLGKALSIAGPVVAAPFTGGASLLGLGATGSAALGAGLGAAGNVLSGIGNTAAGAAKGTADQRVQEAMLRLQAAGNQNTFNLGTARDAYQAKLDKLKLGVELPSTRASQAARGGLMANLQDVSIGRPAGSTIPTFTLSGGLRPSAIGEGGRQAGTELQRQALLALMNGDAIPDYEAPQYQDASQYIGAGGLEKTLGGVGLAGSLAGPILGGILAARQKKPVTTASNTMNPSLLGNVRF